MALIGLEQQFRLKTAAKYLIFIFIASILTYLSDSSCIGKRQARFENLTFNGVINRKYIDTKQHQYRVIELIEAKGTNKYIIRIDDNGLFDYLAINDSIVKRLGEDEVIVFRNLKPKVFVGTDLYLNLD